ncbi:hypothetical protein ACIP5Y_43060 [Nocardia sp. NPDC088792]|uniref:hypothetical protein n=1 Tax=Nocardia sp. NPDC088792 TaxID=3364332 RepID=UPI00382971A6
MRGNALKRKIIAILVGIAVSGLAAGIAEAGTVDAGSYSTRAACESAGQAQRHGDVLGYRCSITSPNSATGDYYYALYLETKDANRPCQNGGTGSASASAELFCLFRNR